MEKEQYWVCGKSEGVNALEGAEEYNSDIILLDVNMPNRTGLETCKQFKENPEPSIYRMGSIRFWWIVHLRPIL